MSYYNDDGEDDYEYDCEEDYDALLPQQKEELEEPEASLAKKDGWMPPYNKGWKDDFFPLKDFREHQEGTIDKILELFAAGKRYVIVEGPTGSGKSVIGITLGRMFDATFIATPQKMLQRQYMDDFSEYLYELRGRANYPCLRIWEKEKEEKEDDVKTIKFDRRKEPDLENKVPEKGKDFIDLKTWLAYDKDHISHKYNCANAPCNTASSKGSDLLKAECKKYEICEYIRRRDYALNFSRFTLMNFSNLILFSRLMSNAFGTKLPYRRRPLLILDECHTLESVLYEYASITVGLKQIKPLAPFTENLEDINRITKPFKDMEEFLSFTEEVILPACKKYEIDAILKEAEKERKAKNKYKQKEEEKPDNEFVEIEVSLEDSVTFDRTSERERIQGLAAKLRALIIEKPTDHSHVLVPEMKEIPGKDMDSLQKECIGLKVKPFSVAHLGTALAFHPSNSRVLLMSATILDSATFCKSVGIPFDEVAFIRVPSTFPAERRLIKGDLTVGSMGYTHKEKTLPKMLDRILELSESHGVHKGIIHTGSYDTMHKLRRWVGKLEDKTLKERLLFQALGTSEEKEEIIRRHGERCGEPTILCGPGFLEGIDLKDDLARFNIIMKIPYPYLGDPLIKRKSQEFPEWYQLQTALALIQAIGRPVRSKTDWAITYILDLMWSWFYKEHKIRLFPKHIQDAVEWIN